jgi:formylglycine-generating enzyme required for sulfatase activity
MKKKMQLMLLACLVIILPITAQQYPEMVPVEGGSFTMGSISDDAPKSEKPAHKVTVSSFSMGKYEVTVAAYREFCLAKKRAMPKAPAWGWVDMQPMVNVGWYDAEDYCKWLSAETGNSYRLPTEAEWEFAAQGGNKSVGNLYAGSNNPDEAGWYKENSNGLTATVGLKIPNELGLFDMSGNVWEWCKDDYTAYTAAAQTNPLVDKVTFLSQVKVIRGGSWGNKALSCLVKSRGVYMKGRDRFYCGFRVVATDL